MIVSHHDGFSCTMCSTSELPWHCTERMWKMKGKSILQQRLQEQQIKQNKTFMIKDNDVFKKKLSAEFYKAQVALILQ